MATMEMFKNKMEMMRQQIRKDFSVNFLSNTSMEGVKIEIDTEDIIEEKPVLDEIPVIHEDKDWLSDEEPESWELKKSKISKSHSRGLCRCCLSEGKFDSIDQRPKFVGNTRSYAEMLRSTLGLKLTRVLAPSLICSTCAVRLRQALSFRKQVVAVERAFIARESANILPEPDDDTSTLKVEPDVSDGKYSTYVDNDMQLNTVSLETNAVSPASAVLDDDGDDDGVATPGPEPVESDVEDSFNLDDDTPLNMIPLAKQKPHPATSKPLTPAPASSLEIKTSNKLKRKRKRYPTKKITCDLCPKMLRKFAMRRHSLKMHLVCYFCKLTFANAEEANAHDAKQHPLKCVPCGLHFSDKVKLKDHRECVHGVRCDICKVVVVGNLHQHKMEVHNLSRDVICGICDLNVRTRAILMRHQRRVHMLQRDLPCPRCDYMAFDAFTLRKHMLVHGVGAEKKHECKHCGKKFVRIGTLTFHERIHTGDKRSVCKLCGEAFVQRASLKYHLEKRHPGEKC